MSLVVALAKGKLLAGTEAVFRRAGLPFPEAAGRRMVVDVDELRFLFVKDADVPTYVEHGAADLGVVGRDVLLEGGHDVYEPLDLGFGRCRLVVAGQPGSAASAATGVVARVATKYPRVAAGHFLARGVSVEIVTLAGSVELAAALGVADVVVDVVETGRTLAENGLVVLEEVACSSARLVVNRASYHARPREMAALLARLRAAVAEGVPAGAGR